MSFEKILLFHCCYNYCFRPTFRYASGSFRYTCVLQILVLKDAIWCIPPAPAARIGTPSLCECFLAGAAAGQQQTHKNIEFDSGVSRVLMVHHGTHDAS